MSTLFPVPDGQNPCQSDVDNLNNLFCAYTEKRINKEHIAIYPDALTDIVDSAHELLQQFATPGPFKKAAVLTASWVANTPYYYLLNDIGQQGAIPEWDSKLAAFSAIGITQLYLTATMPGGWPGVKKETFNPPSLVSNHFLKDLIAVVRIRHKSIDLRILTLNWELMTYLANTETPLNGPLGGDDFDLPGLNGL